MKKSNVSLLLLATYLLSAVSVFGQEKWTTQLSYGAVRGIDKNDKNMIRDYPSASHFRLETGYKVINNLSAGVYIGYARLHRTLTTDNSFASSPTNALFYGLDVDYSVLPLLTGNSNIRFDVYPTLKLGLVSEFWSAPEENRLRKENNTAFEVGAGLGVCYKFTPTLGILGEYTAGKFYNSSNSRFHVGVLFNF
ncbi:MAG: outer membrane beta-barrel protein [Paludibacteraceae bacterium]